MSVSSIPGKKLVFSKKHKMAKFHCNRVISVVCSQLFVKIIIVDWKKGVIHSMDIQR